jgi:MFS family permease
MERRENAYLTIILFGIISLLGDVVYEGVRSISGPFLASLGATSLVIGFFSGLGEFLTQSLRLLFGYISDKKRIYWIFTITGYSLICFLPLCGIANSWQIVVFLLLLERIGKAIRTPSRDTLISFAGKKIGVGKSFGIHEVFDQIGAVLGPLIFFFSLKRFKTYSVGFNIMWIPSIFLIFTLIILRKMYIYDEEMTKKGIQTEGFSRKVFIFYILFVLFSTAGLLNFPLISYHIKKTGIMDESHIPVLYLLAMGIDGLFAFFVGSLYDRIKLKILFIVPLLSIFLPFFCFSISSVLIVFSVLFYGIIIGCHETVLRAAIADVISSGKRGFAYGIFNSIYGFGFLVSGWIIGFLYEKSINQIYFYIIITEIISLFFILSLVFKKYGMAKNRKS